jgi:exopolysaccharide biosynthesis polyprenyl glycosylphosphotransferase
MTQFLFGWFSDGNRRLEPIAELALFALTIPVFVLLIKLYGLYDHDEERPAHTTVDDLNGVFHLVTVGVWAVAAGGWLTGAVRPEFAKLIAFWAIAISLIVLARSIARALARRTSTYIQRTLIVGADGVAQLIAEKLERHPEYGVRVEGFVAELPGASNSHDEHPRLLGRPNELPALVSRLNIERVIIARLHLEESERSELIRSLREQDVQIDIVPRDFETVGPGNAVHMLEGMPIIGLSPIHLSNSSLLLKRTMDIVLSSLGLMILAPVLAFIALRVKLDSSGPIFYRHERLGRNGQPFHLLKFRTMHARYCRGGNYGGKSAEQEFERLMQDASIRAEFQSDFKLRDDPRVTKFGAFLRRTSLDELPQLVNVLRGELSLVGPRPVVAQELGRYGADGETLLAMRPGLTGYWQVNGRSDCGYSERVRLDIAYASNWSLQLDLAILAHTVRVLASRPRGAY